MFEQLLAIVIVLMVYFGFAAVMGSLLRRDKAAAWQVVYGFLLLIPASIAVPLPSPWREVCWLFGCALVLLSFRRLAWLPGWIFSAALTCRYFGTAMYLVLLWAVLFGQPGRWLIIGLPAFAAGYLGWWRSGSYGEESG